jgi:hypothetical protein
MSQQDLESKLRGDDRLDFVSEAYIHGNCYLLTSEGMVYIPNHLKAHINPRKYNFSSLYLKVDEIPEDIRWRPLRE